MARSRAGLCDRSDAVDAFEGSVLDEHGLALHAVGMHYRSTFFDHLFESNYAGTHYSYMWSAMLETAAREWLEHEGGLTRAPGMRLRDELPSRGAVVDPLARVARDHRPQRIGEPLLARRGLSLSRPTG